MCVVEPQQLGWDLWGSLLIADWVICVFDCFVVVVSVNVTGCCFFDNYIHLDYM